MKVGIAVGTAEKMLKTLANLDKLRNAGAVPTGG
jgi:hypothetical protein